MTKCFNKMSLCMGKLRRSSLLSPKVSPQDLHFAFTCKPMFTALLTTVIRQHYYNNTAQPSQSAISVGIRICLCLRLNRSVGARVRGLPVRQKSWVERRLGSAWKEIRLNAILKRMPQPLKVDESHIFRQCGPNSAPFRPEFPFPAFTRPGLRLPLFVPVSLGESESNIVN